MRYHHAITARRRRVCLLGSANVYSGHRGGLSQSRSASRVLVMKQIWKTLVCAALMPAAFALHAQDFLPLGTGNYWSYRASSTNETFTIRVSTPFVINDLVYYSVSGYAQQKLLVRRAPDGSLLALDEETGRESTLASFLPGQEYETNVSGCTQQVEIEPKRTEFNSGAGNFAAAQRLIYTSNSCADTGFSEEVYAENIGMVRRTVTTFMGPREFDLVEARAGKFVMSAEPSNYARISLESNSIQRRSAADPVRLKVNLTCLTTGTLDVKLQFATSQRYELVLRNAEGHVVYRWSDGRMFEQALGEESISGYRNFLIEGELDSGTAASLTNGNYSLEAWLTTVDGPRFAASATVEVFTGELV